MKDRYTISVEDERNIVWVSKETMCYLFLVNCSITDITSISILSTSKMATLIDDFITALT